MAVDSFSQPSSNALNDLGPLSRALLDLSIKRGMSDAEIAEVLGTDSESVLANRVALLRSLVERVAPEAAGADLPELEAVVRERLYGEQNGAGTAESEAEVEPETAPAAPADDRPTRVQTAPDKAERRRRSPLAVLLPLLILIALAAGIVLIASGGGDDDAREPAVDRPQTSDRPADSGPQRARLTALGGGGARGTATVEGSRLRLRASGLPAGTYEVWLYNSIIDAKSLGRLSEDGTLRATLPGTAGQFKYLDISREQDDRNANHSGRSVLRVATRELR